MSIINIGKDDNYPEYLNRKIELCNQVALVLIFLVAIPFVIISYIYFKPLTSIPSLGVGICIASIIFNYFKWHTLARIIICFLPITLANIYGGYLANANEPVLPGFAMIALSFSFVIFLVIDIREKILLVVAGTFMLFFILSMDWFNNQFEITLATEVIETGYLAKVTTLVATLTGTSCILLVILQHKKAEEKASNLLVEAKQNHQKMLEKEEELKENIKVLETSKKEEIQRQWINEGLTNAISLIRDTEETEILYDKLISFIIKRIEAIQGGLFFINENNPDDKYLELEAAYAYNRKKFIDRRIEIGEGLIGQVYIEKEYLLLKEVPDDYINITSGLGEANPNYILIMPIKVNEVVHGVLEIASFYEIEPHKITFLTSLVENIASAFYNNQVNTKTKKLLESTQLQTEALKAQEEEMRQNQEELNAVQEQLSRQKNKLELEIQDLKSTLKTYENS